MLEVLLFDGEIVGLESFLFGSGIRRHVSWHQDYEFKILYETVFFFYYCSVHILEARGGGWSLTEDSFTMDPREPNRYICIFMVQGGWNSKRGRMDVLGSAGAPSMKHSFLDLENVNRFVTFHWLIS